MDVAIEWRLFGPLDRLSLHFKTSPSIPQTVTPRTRPGLDHGFIVGADKTKKIHPGASGNVQRATPGPVPNKSSRKRFQTFFRQEIETPPDR